MYNSDVLKNYFVLISMLKYLFKSNNNFTKQNNIEENYFRINYNI